MVAFRIYQQLNACMPSITIRDVPQEARDELAARAARSGRSLQEYLRVQLIELASSPDQAALAHQDLLALPTQLFAHDVLADRIWGLRHTVTAYDAAYVALAEGLDIALATLDRRLADASGPTCRFELPPT